MEHRHGSRFLINSDIIVKQKNKACGIYHIRDISFGGLFIEKTKQEIPSGVLDLSMKVKIEKPGSNKRLLNFSLKAFVVRKAHDGAGLIWADETESLYQPLYELLRSLSRNDKLLTTQS